MMLSVKYHGPEDLRVEEAPVPGIASDEVLLKVLDAGICGTDLQILHGGHPLVPAGVNRTPGHEVSGEVVEVGSELPQFQPGQRVFVAPNIGCGHCPQCLVGNNNLCINLDAIGVTLDGGFAEYLRVPSAAIRQANLIPLRPGLDPEAAALIEPLACVVRGQNAVDIQPGETVLIMGAGPIGVLHMLMARLRGAARVMISEMAPERIADAEKLGADRVIDLNREDLKAVVAEETGGAGVEVVIVAAPSIPAQQAALQVAGIQGRINIFGALPEGHPPVELDTNQIHYKELVVRATSACSTKNCWQAAAIVNSGKIDLRSLITSRVPLRDALDAYALVNNRQALKVVLQP